MARRPRVRKKPCYECGRRVAVDASSCPHCRAVQQTFCACGAHVSVHATACPLCDAELVPRRFRTSRRWLGPLVVIAVIGAALYGLYVFVERSGPQKQGEALEQATLAFDRGDFTEAERLIRGYHAQFGVRKGTSLLLAQCLVNRGEVEEGLLLMEEISREDPSNIEIHRVRGRIYLRLERWEDAETAARSTVELEAEDGEAHAMLAELAARRGDLSGAARSAREALEGRGAPPGTRMLLSGYLLDAGRTGEALFVLAREAEFGGRRREALDWILHTLTLSPEAEDEAELKARVALEADRESLEAELAGSIADAPALEQSVRLLLALGIPGAPREALDAVQKVRELSPEERLLLARTRAAEGDRAGAASLLGELEADPTAFADPETSGWFRAELAAAWLECDRPERALEFLEGPSGETLPGPVRMRLALRARWWRLARAAPGSGEAIAAALEVLSNATRLRGLRAEDEFALLSENRIRVILGRLEERLAGEVPRHERPAPAVVPGGELDAACAIYRRRPGSVDRDVEARWVLRRALWLGDLRGAGESIPGLVDSSVAALRAGLMALVPDTATATSMARSAAFRESPLTDQCLAARVLAGLGHLSTARELLERMEDGGEAGRTAVFRADLLRALDRPEEAGTAYRKAAGQPGASGAVALMRLAELAVVTGEYDLDPLVEAIRRLAFD